MKTAFTKKYNSMDHPSQALIESILVARKRRGGEQAGGGDGEDGEGEGLDEFGADEERVEQEQDQEEDDKELQAFMKKHSKPMKKQAADTKKGVVKGRGGKKK